MSDQSPNPSCGTAGPIAPTGHAPIRLEMLSQPMYLAGARDLVSAVAKRLGFTDLSCSQIALAVDEALCNIIRHGYQRRTDGPIWISLWPLESPAALKIVIEDEARQVDPATIKSRDLADIRPGGLGVHIIKEVMDEVTYEHRPVAGMRLTLVKRRDAAQQAGAA
ncbi:MAG: ATP-binding protein [Planctomycetota bacterium]|nr:ATP-binding protein [Planctomycetota bacterium]